MPLIHVKLKSQQPWLRMLTAHDHVPTVAKWQLIMLIRAKAKQQQPRFSATCELIKFLPWKNGNSQYRFVGNSNEKNRKFAYQLLITWVATVAKWQFTRLIRGKLKLQKLRSDLIHARRSPGAHAYDVKITVHSAMRFSKKVVAMLRPKVTAS